MRLTAQVYSAKNCSTNYLKHSTQCKIVLHLFIETHDGKITSFWVRQEQWTSIKEPQTNWCTNPEGITSYSHLCETCQFLLYLGQLKTRAYCCMMSLRVDKRKMHLKSRVSDRTILRWNIIFNIERNYSRSLFLCYKYLICSKDQPGTDAVESSFQVIHFNWIETFTWHLNSISW